MNTENFGIFDYIIFILTLGISSVIGIYFGCFGSKQNSASEYLYGKGSIKPIPVGLSLYSSAVSAVTIIGIPAEIYTFGTHFAINILGQFFSIFLIWYLVLPIFCGNRKFKTPYEYFEIRFDYKIRLLTTIIYIIHTLLYMPVVLYSATLAFSELSGISLYICTSVIGGICMFYTLLGGFSAVIWSDTLQATLMFGSCIFVMIKGIIDVGGFSEIWTRADEGGRLNAFTMDLNPFQRLTFWSSLIGMSVTHGAHSGFGASCIQRFMSLKNEKEARISTFVGVVGTCLLGIVGCIIGLAMYALYYNCDPVANKEIQSSNKLVSHYIAHTIKNIPGFLGFFNAGLLSAGLSTLSAELNTVSGLIYHCFIQKMFKKTKTESNGAIIMKIIVFINGLYYILIAPLMEKCNYLFPLALTIGSLTYGAKIGVVVLGAVFPKANSIGVLCGVISGIIVVGWVSIGALYYNVVAPYILPVSTSNCTSSNITSQIFNLTTTLPVTITTTNTLSTNEPFFLYKLSFMYYGILGSLVTIGIGLLVSHITGATDTTKLDPNLLIPRLRPKRINTECEENVKMINIYEVDKI